MFGFMCCTSMSATPSSNNRLRLTIETRSRWPAIATAAVGSRFPRCGSETLNRCESRGPNLHLSQLHGLYPYVTESSCLGSIPAAWALSLWVTRDLVIWVTLNASLVKPASCLIGHMQPTYHNQQSWEYTVKVNLLPLIRLVIGRRWEKGPLVVTATLAGEPSRSTVVEWSGPPPGSEAPGKFTQPTSWPTRQAQFTNGRPVRWHKRDPNQHKLSPKLYIYI